MTPPVEIGPHFRTYSCHATFINAPRSRRRKPIVSTPLFLLGSQLSARLHFCSGRNYRNASSDDSTTITHQPPLSTSAPRSRRRKPRPCRHRHRRTFRWLYRSGQPSPHLPQPEKKMKFSTNKYTSVSSKPYKPTNDQTFFLHVTRSTSFCRDSTHSLTLDLESDVAVGENLRHLVQVQPLAIFRRHGE